MKMAAGREGGRGGCLSLHNTSQFLLLAKFSHMYSSTLSLLVKWYLWSLLTEEETKYLKGLHDDLQSHS